MNKQIGTAFFNTDKVILMAFVAVAAAISLPLINKYRIAKNVEQIIQSTEAIKSQVSDHALAHGKWPLDLKSMKIAAEIELSSGSHYEIKNGVLYVYLDDEPQLQGQLIFTPSRLSNGISWVCDDSSIPSEYQSDEC